MGKHSASGGRRPSEAPRHSDGSGRGTAWYDAGRHAPRQGHGWVVALVAILACLAVGFAWARLAGPLAPTAGSTGDESAAAANEATVSDVSAESAGDTTGEADAGEEDTAGQASGEDEGVQPSENEVEGTVGDLSVKAPDNLADSEAYASLVAAMEAYEGQGYDMGFYLEDLTSGAYVAYKEHDTFYSASSIKGPYAMALYQTQVDGGSVSESSVRGTVENLIVNSDNDAYRSLHRTYGEKFFANWILDAGYADGDASRLYSHYYQTCSAADMAAAWRKGYGYLTGGTQAANDLAGYFENRTESAIKRAVGDRYRSWGKAGWYYASDGYGAAPAMNDCGIVFADSGTYLVAFMSDGYGNFDSAAQVLAALDQVHDFIA